MIDSYIKKFRDTIGVEPAKTYYLDLQNMIFNNYKSYLSDKLKISNNYETELVVIRSYNKVTSSIASKSTSAIIIDEYQGCTFDRLNKVLIAPDCSDRLLHGLFCILLSEELYCKYFDNTYKTIRRVFSLEIEIAEKFFNEFNPEQLIKRRIIQDVFVICHELTHILLDISKAKDEELNVIKSELVDYDSKCLNLEAPGKKEIFEKVYSSKLSWEDFLDKANKTRVPIAQYINNQVDFEEFYCDMMSLKFLIDTSEAFEISSNEIFNYVRELIAHLNFLYRIRKLCRPGTVSDESKNDSMDNEILRSRIRKSSINHIQNMLLKSELNDVDYNNRLYENHDQKVKHNNVFLHGLDRFVKKKDSTILIDNKMLVSLEEDSYYVI